MNKLSTSEYGNLNILRSKRVFYFFFLHFIRGARKRENPKKPYGIARETRKTLLVFFVFFFHATLKDLQRCEFFYKQFATYPPYA